MEADLFFRLDFTHYERGFVLLTSYKLVRDRSEIFAGDDILAPAIFDRISIMSLSSPLEQYNLRRS